MKELLRELAGFVDLEPGQFLFSFLEGGVPNLCIQGVGFCADVSVVGGVLVVEVMVPEDGDYCDSFEAELVSPSCIGGALDFLERVGFPVLDISRSGVRR